MRVFVDGEVVSMPANEALPLVETGEALVTSLPDPDGDLPALPPLPYCEIVADRDLEIWSELKKRILVFVKGSTIDYTPVWRSGMHGLLKAGLAHAVRRPITSRTLIVRVPRPVEIAPGLVALPGEAVAFADPSRADQWIPGESLWPNEGDIETDLWISLGCEGGSHCVRVVAHLTEDAFGYRRGDRVEVSWEAYRQAPLPGVVVKVELMPRRQIPRLDEHGKIELYSDASYREGAPKVPKRSGGRPAKALGKALPWLFRRLADGPVSNRIIAAEAQGLGLSVRTLRRAREELGVRTDRKGMPPNQRVKWALPDSDSITTAGAAIARRVEKGPDE